MNSDKTNDPENPVKAETVIERARACIPDDIGSVAHTFRLLSDETRCKIVTALLCGELSVHQIAEVVSSSMSNVSHHLRLLRVARLVKHRREQRNVYYSLDDDHVMTLISQVLEHLSHK